MMRRFFLLSGALMLCNPSREKMKQKDVLARLPDPSFWYFSSFLPVRGSPPVSAFSAYSINMNTEKSTLLFSFQFLDPFVARKAVVGGFKECDMFFTHLRGGGDTTMYREQKKLTSFFCVRFLCVKTLSAKKLFVLRRRFQSPSVARCLLLSRLLVCRFRGVSTERGKCAFPREGKHRISRRGTP